MTREEIYSRFEELDKRASLGGGVDKIEKQHAQGKMTARERIGMLHRQTPDGRLSFRNR